MNLVEIFISYLPYSLVIFLVPVIIWFIFKGEKQKVIINKVLIFFKGGTMDFYDASVERGAVKFSIDDIDYSEPTHYHPRIMYDKKTGQIARTYLYAEGLGIVDVPPLLKDDLRKIVEYLIEHGIIPVDDRKENIDDYTEDELIDYIKFYNLDIEQITDKPMLKSFSTSMNAFEHLASFLMGQISKLEGEGTNNFKIFLIYLAGSLTGFGMAWALTLKGVI